MLIDTSKRSDAPETMDDFSLEGDVLKDALDKIADINTLLGGNKVTIQGVKELIRNIPRNRTITILDVGCGNGDMLRALANFGAKHGFEFKLTGMDANQFTIHHAESLSMSYPNISYICEDIFSVVPASKSYDIIVCTLTLHHFKDNEIIELLEKFIKMSTAGVIINDLHRSKLAYYLFKGICTIFGLNEMSREDGLVSILRGFKQRDLRYYSQRLNLKDFSIRWKWAFRYQWIIKTT